MTDSTRITEPSFIQNIPNEPLGSREDVVACIEALGQKLESGMDDALREKLGETTFGHNLQLVQKRAPNMSEMLGNAFDRGKKITPRMISYFMGEDNGCTNHAVLGIATDGYRDYKTSEPVEYGASWLRQEHDRNIDKSIDDFHANGCEKPIYSHTPRVGQESQR